MPTLVKMSVRLRIIKEKAPKQFSKCFWLNSYLILLAQIIFAQTNLPDSVEAYMLHYKTLPPLKRLDAEIPASLKDYFLVLAPPYCLIKPPKSISEIYYYLHDQNSGRTFLCQELEGGISFEPEKLYLRKDPVIHLTWKKDTIKGYEVFETNRYLEKDTLRSWNTDHFGVSYSSYAQMRGIPLYIEDYSEGEIWRHVLHKADTIKLASRFFDPKQSNALFDFSSPKEVFDPSINKNSINFNLLGYKCSNLKGKILNQNRKVNIDKLQGNIVVLIFIDYTLTERLPTYLKEWILPLTDSSNIKPFVLTRSYKSTVLEMFKKDPDLASIPHMLVNEAKYFQHSGYGPLYVLLLDQGGIIRCAINGYYLFSADILDEKIKFLQESWEK